MEEDKYNKKVTTLKNNERNVCKTFKKFCGVDI